MKNIINKKMLFYSIALIAVVWIGLTLYVQRSGPNITFAHETAHPVARALIVYSPDPFYNLDEQICKGFGKGLLAEEWSVDVQSTTAAWDFQKDYDLFVFCANTYNWSPDWSITYFIKTHEAIKEKPVIALTVGAGSTKRAQQVFEKLILKTDIELLASESYWWMRPNKEGEESNNIAVAVAQAKQLGREVGAEFGRNIVAE